MQSNLAQTAHPAVIQPRSFWRSAGAWMAVVLVVFQLFNVVRVFINPVDFAEYFGLPLSAPEAAGFVWVYAIRTLFIAVFGAALLWRRDQRTLALFALLALIAPIGDALLVLVNGAPTSILVRHILIAVFVAATWFMLSRSPVKAA